MPTPADLEHVQTFTRAYRNDILEEPISQDCLDSLREAVARIIMSEYGACRMYRDLEIQSNGHYVRVIINLRRINEVAYRTLVLKINKSRGYYAYILEGFDPSGETYRLRSNFLSEVLSGASPTAYRNFRRGVFGEEFATTPDPVSIMDREG
jgi:hypothetical protein